MVDPDSSRVRVSVTDATGRPIRDGGLAVWLAATAPPRAAGAVAVALVSDARVRALNRQYRGKDSATDVLSFPVEPRTADPESPPPREALRRDRAEAKAKAGRIPDPGSLQRRLLGDIVIATGVARRQAREAGHSYQTELRVLALHGLLHLLGYDHERRDDRGRMARVEARLRRRGGLNVGLIERSHA